MHETLLLSLSLLLAVTVFVMVGQQLKISSPIFLVLSGLALSLIPGIPVLTIDPELIFLLFLPPLLYEAAWYTSWREFWRWRRSIGTLGFGLVIVTALAVAYASQALIPGFTLALGFLLGGIVSPPDAVAAASVLRGITVPKRLISVLEGESLVNDAASLVVFRFALAAVLSGTFVLHEAATDFVLVTVLGIGVGLAVAGVFYVIHRYLPTTTRISILLTFLAPYFMYLAAEEMHGSGVMAVVSGGLFMSNRSHQILNHSARIQGTGMWATVVFALNGLVFILIGLQMPVVASGLENYTRLELIGYAVLITLVVMIVRVAVVLSTSLFTRLVSRFVPVADPNPGWRGPLIIGWAGMRGVVSLASALSIPLTLANGQPFPHRNLILFITFVVILATLVFQGLTLPFVIQLVRYEDPDNRAPEEQQSALIRMRLLKAALRHVQQEYATEIAENELVENLKNRLVADVQLTGQRLSSLDCGVEKMEEYNRVITGVTRAKRQVLLTLRRQASFDDEVIRKEEARIDLDEEKIDHPMH